MPFRMLVSRSVSGRTLVSFARHTASAAATNCALLGDVGATVAAGVCVAGVRVPSHAPANPAGEHGFEELLDSAGGGSASQETRW